MAGRISPFLHWEVVSFMLHTLLPAQRERRAQAKVINLFVTRATAQEKQLSQGEVSAQ